MSLIFLASIFLYPRKKPASFSFIFGLFKQTIPFLQQINAKNVMIIQYTVPGFEPTTSWHELSPIHTRPGLPPYSLPTYRPWHRAQLSFDLRLHFFTFNKEWAIPGLFFLYFDLFNTVDRNQMFYINFADDWIRSADLWIWSTALPTEPQPLPLSYLSFHQKTVSFPVFRNQLPNLWTFYEPRAVNRHFSC